MYLMERMRVMGG